MRTGEVKRVGPNDFIVVDDAGNVVSAHSCRDWADQARAAWASDEDFRIRFLRAWTILFVRIAAILFR